MEWEVGWRFKREGTYVYLWLIHVVWQKKYNIVSNYLPIKNKFKTKQTKNVTTGSDSWSFAQ